jgi:hypothetical protein
MLWLRSQWCWRKHESVSLVQEADNDTCQLRPFGLTLVHPVCPLRPRPACNKSANPVLETYGIDSAVNCMQLSTIELQNTKKCSSPPHLQFRALSLFKSSSLFMHAKVPTIENEYNPRHLIHMIENGYVLTFNNSWDIYSRRTYEYW